MQYSINIYNGIEWTLYRDGLLNTQNKHNHLFLLLYEIALFYPENVQELEIDIQNGEKKQEIKMIDYSSTVLNFAMLIKNNTIDF